MRVQWLCMCLCISMTKASTVTVSFTIEDFSSSLSESFIAAQLLSDFSVSQASIVSLTEGVVSVQSCTAGTYAQSGTDQCALCSAGKYSTELNAIAESSCLSCGAGTFSTTQGATSDQTCQTCVSGTYNPTYGASRSSMCLDCPVNSSSSSGSTHIQACVCNPGFSGKNGEACVGCNTSVWCLNGQVNPCPPHSLSYALSSDVRQCICKPGYYGDTGPGYADTSLYPMLCQFCKEDHFCPGGGVNVSFVCPDGKYSLPGSDDNTDCNCPEFSTSQRNSQNSSQCICGPGYRKVYKANSPIGGWVCELCGVNEYCYNDQGTSCPQHSSSYAGSDVLLDCFCDPGFQNATSQDSSHLCDNCDSNYYCNGKGSKQACTLHAVSPTQSPDYTKCYCDWGYKGLNNSQCIACGSPKYCYGGVEGTCTEDSSSVALAWSPLNCTCNSGRWGPNGGPCVKCAAGKYKTFQGCITCVSVQDDDCTACTSGTFSSVIGRSRDCDVCEPGTFSVTGATTCSECSSGTYSDTRASVCSSCVLGYFSLPRSTTCWSCGLGKYMDTPGQSSESDCKLCPMGSFTANNGTNISSCYACSAGSSNERYWHITDSASFSSMSAQVLATQLSISNDFSVKFTVKNLPTPNAAGDYQDILFISSPDETITYVQVLYDASGLLVSTGRICYLVLPLDHTVSEWRVRVTVSGGSMFGWINDIHVGTSITCTVGALNTLIAIDAKFTLGGMYPPSSGLLTFVDITTTVGSSACSTCPVNTFSERRASVCLPCPEHSTSNVGSNMGQCTCDANYEKKNATLAFSGGPPFACVACSEGFTSTRGGTCQACPSGSYQLGLTCEVCNAGTFAVNGATYCDSCTTGTFSARGASTCTLCTPGKFNPDNGSMGCVSCEAGYFSLSGASSCQACDPGFISASGMSVCSPCARGEYAASGAIQCSRCIPGTWSNASIGSVLECKSCGAGSYSTTLGANTSSVCKLCDPGLFSAEAIAPNVNSCVNCEAGQFSKAGASICVTCQNGTFSHTKASECLGCSQGSFSLYGSSTCTMCQPGTYSEIPNGTSGRVCMECENGTFSNRSGVSAHQECIWCAAGFYALSGSTSCTACEAEMYSGQHSGSCLGCPQYSDAPLGSSLSGCICRAGFRYNRSQQVFTCDACSPGTWAGLNSEVCNSCPAGKVSPIMRATGADTCTPCLGGTVASFEGSSTCTSCAAGLYSGNSSSVCVNCTQGTWSSAQASVCIVCVAGTYSVTQLGPSSSVCIPCISGKFSTALGATMESTCEACPAGSRSGLGEGSTSCSTCPANTYSDQLSDVCLKCPSNSTSVSGSDMNGCVCKEGTHTYYKSRGSGGLMSYILDDASGFVYMVHFFSGNGTWILNVFLDTVIDATCDGIPDPVQMLVWVKGLRNIRSAFSCSSNISLKYRVDGPFSLNVSTTYFKCESCNSGFYSNRGMDSCMPCPAGTYQANPGAGGIQSCRSCDAGYITAGTGASFCTVCESGAYQANTTTCVDCPSGTFTGSAKTVCSICPANLWAGVKSGACQACPEHSNSTNGSALLGCLCLPGYHHVGLINSSGWVDLENFTCEGCRAGYYSGSNYSTCLPCGTGRYSNALSESCTLCVSGKYQPLSVGPNETACIPCSSGSNSEPGSSACVSCPASFYCTGAGIQEPCPPGSYSPTAGLQNASSCPVCPADSFCVDTLTLEYCPANTHSDAGSTSKLQCLCDPGYTCTYKKAIKAVVTLPLTEAQFELVKNEFLQAVADAAGVTVDKVAIVSIRPRPVTNRRRLLALSVSGKKKHTTGDVSIHVRVREAHTLETLNNHLTKRGIPRSSGMRVHHKHRLTVTRMRILQFI